MSTRHTHNQSSIRFCGCGHTQPGHLSRVGRCRALLCNCRQFRAAPRLIRVVPLEQSPIPRATVLDIEAAAVLAVINAKLGFHVKQTEKGIEVEAVVGGQIVNCKREPVERVKGTGETLTAALRALLKEVGQ